MMSYIIFYLYILVGYVSPMNEVHEGRDLYVLEFKDGKVAEYCYKEEIIHYIETGEFEYNDFE